MKSPKVQRPDDQARDATEEFIAKNSRKPGTEPVAKPASKKAKKAAAAKRDE